MKMALESNDTLKWEHLQVTKHFRFMEKGVFKTKCWGEYQT